MELLMIRQQKRALWWVLASMWVCCVLVVPASALESANYRIDESAISTGNLLQSSSTNYKALDGINDLAIGNSTSSNYQVNAGTKTDPYPWLSFIIVSSNASFGVLSATTAATATASFSVLNYTSYGYVVQVEGSTPTNGAHSLPAMTTEASQTGVEQFGMNLVANTQPKNPLGANPDNGQFGYGTVSANYATTNIFTYSDGSVIASAPKSSGVTTYTISYVMNVKPLTPGGQYNANQSLVVTGTY